MDRWIRLEKANIFVHVRTSVFIHAYTKVLVCFLFLVTLLWIYDWGLSMKLHSQFQHMAFCSLFTMWLKVKSFFWRGIFSLLYTKLGCFFLKSKCQCFKPWLQNSKVDNNNTYTTYIYVLQRKKNSVYLCTFL